MISTALKTLSVSIIIPVLNEEQTVGVRLDRLLARNRQGNRERAEIIIVDGGSTDQTIREVAARGLVPLSSRPGRGVQQHKGARAAGGDILLFLHCDTDVPRNFIEHIRETLQDKNIAAGAFRLVIKGAGPGYRLIEAGALVRSKLFGLPYGDQALFMRRATYFAAGGFPQQPIMEDVVLVRRLKKLGTIALTPARASTSARRWQQYGLVRTTLINQLMLLGAALGVSPQRLARFYYAKRK